MHPVDIYSHHLAWQSTVVASCAREPCPTEPLTFYVLPVFGFRLELDIDLSNADFACQTGNADLDSDCVDARRTTRSAWERAWLRRAQSEMHYFIGS